MFKVLIVLSSLGLISCTSKNTEVTNMLDDIAGQYSPPLVISFLHEQINQSVQMIKKIETFYTDLDKTKRNNFDVAVKSLQILDQQLTDHDKINYFGHNGTQRIKDFISQFKLISEMFPIHLDSDGSDKATKTVDFLISSLNVTKNDDLITDTEEVIATYIKDITEKETSDQSNRLQKLSASLAKVKLQRLANYTYSVPYTERRCTLNYCYYESQYTNIIIDKRAYELEKVLRQVAEIVDLFYSKFTYLTVEQPHDEIKENELIRKPTSSKYWIMNTTTSYSLDN